jgi:hypothetical protein
MKNRVDGTATIKKKIVSLMVEMLQNIIHHGDKCADGNNGSQGIFYISEKNHKYYLTTINYIDNHKIATLKEKIDYINNLDDKGREQNYNSRHFDFKSCSNKESGLGLIEMRQKSKNPIEYEFTNLDDNQSLFKISTSINL